MANQKDKPAERLFRSIDGSDIRVTHPSGDVAIVGETPRTLPPKLWRAAIKQGCTTEGAFTPAELPPLTVQNDPHTRKEAIKAKMVEALESDETDTKYEDAFTAAGIPNVRWLEKALGFGMSADERDACWAEVKAEQPEEEEEEEESE